MLTEERGQSLSCLVCVQHCVSIEEARGALSSGAHSVGGMRAADQQHPAQRDRRRAYHRHLCLGDQVYSKATAGKSGSSLGAEYRQKPEG